MFKALRLIFFDRRVIALALYFVMALGLYIMLEPPARFRLDDDEMRSTNHFTPDGRWLAIAINQPTPDADKSSAIVRMRDLRTDSTLKQLGTIRGSGARIEFSPDKQMLIASTDREIISWRIDDGSVVYQCAMPGQAIQMILGQRLFALCRPHEDSTRAGHVIDIATGRTVVKVEPILQDYAPIVVNADGSKLLSFGHDNNENVLRVWSTATGEMISERREPGKRDNSTMCFGPDDRTILWIKNGMDRNWTWPPTVVDTELIEMNLADPKMDRRYAFPSTNMQGRQIPTYFPSESTKMQIVADGRLQIKSYGRSHLFNLTNLQPEGGVSEDNLSPGGIYRLRENVERTKFPQSHTYIIEESATGLETGRIEVTYDYGMYRTCKGWTPDGKYLIFEGYNQGGLPSWLRQLLQKIKLNLDWSSRTIYEKQLVNPRTGRVDSFLKSDIATSIQFAPDSQAAIFDGHVYDVPFRKPWWAILGLPAVLALVVWRPYRRAKRSAPQSARRG